jgi:alpha,alpha-trehalase
VSSLPIGDYALLSDCRSAALVSSAGSVDWLCCPRFDAPAVFARLLDAGGGHFAIRPAGDFQASRAYIEQTMVLETTFRTETGTAVLTDALALGRNDRGHQLGAHSPGVLIRQLRCTRGELDVDVTYAPRPEYGLIDPVLEEITGAINARGGASRLVLSVPPGFALAGATATARLHLRSRQTVNFALQHGQLAEPPLAVWDAAETAARLQDTQEGWQSWSAIPDHQSYRGPWRDHVLHSGRVLQALTFQPTGAIVAAPTTSLPEAIGGERNWDYRYTWVRDASLTLEALWVAACPHEAGKFFGFLADAAATQIGPGTDLQIMFGVGGEHDLSERELPHLAGWRASRPVRVGNGAWNQRQLDVYGELLGAAHRLAGELGQPDPVTQRFLAGAAESAASRWTQKDRGIWEIRGEPRDFLYSKLMCWVALDRAIVLAPQLGAEDRTEAWTAARDQIRAAILERGWNQQAGAFTQAFGTQDLDASSLMLAITGFLPGDDPRMKATIDATAARLADKRGLVYRYLSQDGLDGAEGSFLLCTFWLAHAQALAGELDQATATFGRAVAAINDVGLLAEEVDPGTGEMIGNFPQAFSHIGLINAAWAIAQAQERAAGPVLAEGLVDGLDVTGAAVGSDDAGPHLVHHVGDRHPTPEVHDDHRPAPATPEADLLVGDPGDGVESGQPVADAPAQRHAHDYVGAVDLLIEDQLDGLRAQQPDAVDFSALRQDGHDAGDRPRVAVAVSGPDVGVAPALGVGVVREDRRTGKGLDDRAVAAKSFQVERQRRRRDDGRDALPVTLGGADLEVCPERARDLLGHELLERLAGDPAYQLSDQVPEVERVVPRRGSRFPPGGLPGHPACRPVPVVQVLDRCGLVEPGDSGAVREQVANLHVLLAVDGELRPVRSDGGVDVELTAVGQHERGQAGDGLGRGPHVGDGVLVPLLGPGLVTEATPHVDDLLAVDVEDQ